jgi:hypothetical protein
VTEVCSSSDEKVESVLEYNLKAADESGNPIYLWSVIETVVATGQPLPQAVADYLVKVAREIRKARAAHWDNKISSNEAVKRATAALGLVQPGWNAFRKHAKDNHAVWTALDHAALGGGESATNALSKERGVSDRTVYRDMSRYEELPKLKD